MSKNNTNVKKINNEGFSLVEVLVAVIILALVAGPILMAFVMSARFNARARESQRVTAVAESVMEEFKGMSIKEARTAGSGYTDITPIGATSFTFQGLKPIDGHDYDVKVTATPLRDKEAENLNGGDVTKDSYVNDAFMDPYSTFVYTQDLYQDKEIYDQMLNNIYTFLDDNYNFSVVNPGVSASDLDKDKINADRIIVLEITGDEDEQNVRVIYYYNYKIENYPVPGYGDIDFTFAQIIYETPIPPKTYKGLNKAYLFYSPAYKSYPARKVAHFRADQIIVANHSSRYIQSYVVKQVNPLYENLMTCDAEYFPTITAMGAGPMDMYTYIYDTDSTDDFGDKSHDSLLYSLKVEVFESGAGMAGTPLYTLDGSINSKEN